MRRTAVSLSKSMNLTQERWHWLAESIKNGEWVGPRVLTLSILLVLVVVYASAYRHGYSRGFGKASSLMNHLHTKQTKEILESSADGSRAQCTEGEQHQNHKTDLTNLHHHNGEQHGSSPDSKHPDVVQAEEAENSLTGSEEGSGGSEEKEEVEQVPEKTIEELMEEEDRRRMTMRWWKDARMTATHHFHRSSSKGLGRIEPDEYFLLPDLHWLNPNSKVTALVDVYHLALALHRTIILFQEVSLQDGRWLGFFNVSYLVEAYRWINFSTFVSLWSEHSSSSKPMCTDYFAISAYNGDDSLILLWWLVNYSYS